MRNALNTRMASGCTVHLLSVLVMKESVTARKIGRNSCPIRLRKNICLMPTEIGSVDIAVIFGRDMEVKEILVGPELLTDDEDDLWNAFDGMWIDVPTPFKEGDIVFTNGRCSGRIPRPFVLTFLANDKKTERDRKYVERRLTHGHSMDMTAYGYRINKDNGEVYLECDHDYLSVEYYEEKLWGYERTLYAVSAWMSRKDVGLQSLMNSYLYVLTDEEWKRQKRNWRWDLEQVGIVRHNK